tara:strand:- start:9724 stop:9978 length:255 start_codon:yes stop_codon:yes gene_type:complete
MPVLILVLTVAGAALESTILAKISIVSPNFPFTLIQLILAKINVRHLLQGGYHSFSDRESQNPRSQLTTESVTDSPITREFPTE